MTDPNDSTPPKEIEKEDPIEEVEDSDDDNDDDDDDSIDDEDDVNGNKN